MAALRPFGLEVKATEGSYHATVNRAISPTRPIVLTERGDTVTENALLAAARHDGVTVIRNASPNYMVQDLCFFLEKLGVRIDGIGTTTLTVHGTPDIDVDVDYAPSRGPDRGDVAARRRDRHRAPRSPSAGCRSSSSRSSSRCWRRWASATSRSEEYVAANEHTRLVDITTRHSELHSPIDKIHPMPFPGLNIDNLPFFAVIAAVAEGQTLLHDWVYENRAIYLTELTKLGASVKLLDPHRVMIEGPTRWSRHRDRLPAGAASGGGDPAGDAGLEGHLGAALGLRDQPRLRGPGHPAQRPRRQHRDLPRHLTRRRPRRPADPSTRRGDARPTRRRRRCGRPTPSAAAYADQSRRVGAVRPARVAASRRRGSRVRPERRVS